MRDFVHSRISPNPAGMQGIVYVGCRSDSPIRHRRVGEGRVRNLICPDKPKKRLLHRGIPKAPVYNLIWFGCIRNKQHNLLVYT
jgi:hypothetical protein